MQWEHRMPTSTRQCITRTTRERHYSPNIRRIDYSGKVHWRHVHYLDTVWQPKRMENFKENTPFGILEWEVEERKTSVNFLDLTKYINKNRIIKTRTYQRSINLYLYLTPSWVHPLSLIRRMIYGMLIKNDEHKCHWKHYIGITVLLLWRLAMHGWDTTLLQRTFNEASEKVETKYPTQTNKKTGYHNNGKHRIFIYTEYHSNGIT